MTYPIQKNIPHPGPMQSNLKYPFDDMEVGDSFFVPNVTPSKLCQAGASYARRRSNKKKFSARAEHDGTRDGARIWRVE